MLQSIHDKLKGWLAGVVLGIIGLVFVFWGINWTLTAPSYAAKVNGSEVSVNDVRQSYQQELAQVEKQANGSLSDAQRNDIKKRVLDQYVNSEALLTRADALGYRVSDSDLLKTMAQVPAFQVDGGHLRHRFEQIRIADPITERIRACEQRLAVHILIEHALLDVVALSIAERSVGLLFDLRKF